jgi:translation initiation factor IF-2
MAKNVTCEYRINAMVKADTIYELEAIKAELTKAGATILHIDAITIVADERPDPPTIVDWTIS